MTQRLSYHPELDGLRCLAVCLVLVSHLPAIANVAMWDGVKLLGSAMRAGYLGVDIFFVLSGFLITRILLMDRGKQTFDVIRLFYIKRFLRIFPIFYLTVIYCWLFLSVPISETLANLFYISNYYYSVVDRASPLRHTWSLSVEEQFYLFWPFLVLLVPLARLNAVIIFGTLTTVLVSALLAYALLSADTVNLLMVRGVMFRFLSLAAGAFLALHFERVMQMKVWPMLVCAIVIFPPLQLMIRIWSGPLSELVLLFVFTGWSVAIFLSVLLCSRSDNFVRKVFQARVSVYIGQISYGIYLYHLVILHQMNLRDGYRDSAVPLWEFSLAIALTLGVSMVSFHLLEAPLLGLKSRIAARRGLAANA